MPVAIITGASQGLGRALAAELSARGWSLALDARHPDPLNQLAASLDGDHRVVVGDVADAHHRDALVAAAVDLGGPDLLVNNASTLGASPLPRFADLDPATYLRVLEVNVVAPMTLTAAVLPTLRQRSGAVVNISSDAAVEPYETWGAYASSKAALDHATRILVEEEPDVFAYAVDPGDMRTAMHQDAFPGEDISDRPLPETVAPYLADLAVSRAPGGRYRIAELVPA